eukprot:gene11505-biopygen22891
MRSSPEPSGHKRQKHSPICSTTSTSCACKRGVSTPRLQAPLNAPAGPGRIAKSALARVLGAEWRKRIPAHKAAIRQMHCAPGPAGAACWHPIRVGYGTLVASPESHNSEILVDFDACWTPQPQDPPPPGQRK